ncbi:MAG: hypothetical protein JW864_13335 [Spirochaetes bacterium]|nr:hypothetical protein [Spirochaetota bacterium]
MKEKRIPVEVYSRVVGYFRPVNQWNKGKKEEFGERNVFDPEEIIGVCVDEYQGSAKDIAC